MSHNIIDIEEKFHRAWTVGFYAEADSTSPLHDSIFIPYTHPGARQAFLDGRAYGKTEEGKDLYMSNEYIKNGGLMVSLDELHMRAKILLEDITAEMPHSTPEQCDILHAMGLELDDCFKNVKSLSQVGDRTEACILLDARMDNICAQLAAIN